MQEKDAIWISSFHKESDVEVAKTIVSENTAISIGVWHDNKATGRRAFLTIDQTKELIKVLQELVKEVKA